MSPGNAAAPAAALGDGEFRALDGLIYVNAASYGPMPARACAEVHAYHLRRSAARPREEDHAPTLDRARAAAARLIGAEPSEIALTPNTSAGINIASALLLARQQAGDARTTIVVSDREFPANMYPWLELERFGFHVRIVPADALGRPDEDRLAEAIAGTHDVALFALSAVQFASGWLADLDRFGSLCRAHDVLFCVDAIQMLGALPLDVRKTPIDVLACGGQKWLLSPHGAGFAYVRRDLHSLRPFPTGWLSYEASADFTRLLSYDLKLADDARRFEVGTLATQDLLGLAVSIELLLECGIDRIAAHNRALRQPLHEWLDGAEEALCVSPRDGTHESGIVCFRLPDADRVHAQLNEQGVVCALREGAIRISPHLYNSADQMERIVTTLRSACRS